MTKQQYTKLKHLTVTMVAAESAYREYARGWQGRSKRDPFYKTRLADFHAGAEAGKELCAELDKQGRTRHQEWNIFTHSPMLDGAKGLWWRNFPPQLGDETRFEYLARRMLRVVLLTYAKHGMGCEDVIGWNELSDELHNVICECIGDDAFCEWGDKLKADCASGDVDDD